MQSVTISSALPIKKATEWLTSADIPMNQDQAQSRMTIAVPAGGVRIIELR
jgi:hypothetical protein